MASAPPDTATPVPEARWVRALGPCVVAAAFVVGLRWSWLKWPDPLVDFGRELYVPWRLAEGDVLYRDIAYWTGPLSVYLNAGLFRLFGASLRTLVGSNAIVFALVLWLCHRLVARGAGRLAGAVACLVCIAAFGFGQLIWCGNFNFMAPYRHEMTHGLLLGLAGLDAAAAFTHSGRVRWVLAAGMACGLALLTKVEMAGAAGVAVSLAIALGTWVRRVDTSAVVRVAACFAAGVALPPALGLAAFSLALGPTGAARALAAPYLAATSGKYTGSAFFAAGAGLESPGHGLWWTGFWFVAAALLVGVGIGLARAGRRSPRAAVLAAILLALLLVGLPSSATWLRACRALTPLVALVIGVGCVRIALGGRDARAAWAERLPLAVFAGMLLVKMGLFARTWHYGFVLALPAVVLTCALLFGWLPAWLARRDLPAAPMRIVALAVCVGLALAHVRESQPYLDARTQRLGSGADAFYADERGGILDTLRRKIAEVSAPDATLTVMPEGVMLNYLTRRRAGIPYLEMLPSEIEYFGEARILAALRQNKPDLVALVERETSEYGVRYLGRDYAPSLPAFLASGYDLVAAYGAPPLRGLGFGAVLARRSQTHPAPPAAPPAPTVR